MSGRPVRGKRVAGRTEAQRLVEIRAALERKAKRRRAHQQPQANRSNRE